VPPLIEHIAACGFTARRGKIEYWIESSQLGRDARARDLWFESLDFDGEILGEGHADRRFQSEMQRPWPRNGFAGQRGEREKQKRNDADK